MAFSLMSPFMIKKNFRKRNTREQLVELPKILNSVLSIEGMISYGTQKLYYDGE